MNCHPERVLVSVYIYFIRDHGGRLSVIFYISSVTHAYMNGVSHRMREKENRYVFVYIYIGVLLLKIVNNNFKCCVILRQVNYRLIKINNLFIVQLKHQTITTRFSNDHLLA